MLAGDLRQENSPVEWAAGLQHGIKPAGRVLIWAGAPHPLAPARESDRAAHGGEFSAPAITRNTQQVTLDKMPLRALIKSCGRAAIALASAQSAAVGYRD